jgi:hypothetical protein
MTVLQLAVGLVALAVTSQVSLLSKQIFANQTPPEIGILRSAAAKIERVEPDWRFISGICNFPGPLLKNRWALSVGFGNHAENPW